MFNCTTYVPASRQGDDLITEALDQLRERTMDDTKSGFTVSNENTMKIKLGEPKDNDVVSTIV